MIGLLAAMGDWQPHELQLSLDFLDESSAYHAVICEDGINADRYASDYAIYGIKTLQQGHSHNKTCSRWRFHDEVKKTIIFSRFLAT